MRSREVNRKIERAGGYPVRQTGSHRRYSVDYTRPDGTTGKVSTNGPAAPGRHRPRNTYLDREATRTGTREGVAPVTTYRVVVTREGSNWLADVPELEGSQTYATSLTALDRYVREVIVLGADLPDEAIGSLSIEYVYELDDELVNEAAAARRERENLAQREAQLKERTQRLAQQLTTSGYSARDAGPLLGISHQRVSQVASGQEEAPTAAARAARRRARGGARRQATSNRGDRTSA